MGEPEAVLEPGHRASRKWLSAAHSNRAQSHLHSRYVPYLEAREREQRPKHWQVEMPSGGDGNEKLICIRDNGCGGGDGGGN